jgi:hypothetical protein
MKLNEPALLDGDIEALLLALCDKKGKHLFPSELSGAWEGCFVYTIQPRRIAD